MRMRNKPWTAEWWNKNRKLLFENKIKQDSKIIPCDRDVNIEIGCGKGDFIIKKSCLEPMTFFIAIEKDPNALAVAMKKYITDEANYNKNLLFSNILAENLKDFFSSNSFSKIFLNFSDPWPKKQHYKRRLTYKRYLQIYYELLKDGGEIHIKTDNESLYNFTLEEVNEFKNFLILYKTYDLYNDSEQLKNNIETEYERKFVSEGLKIKKIILSK